VTFVPAERLNLYNPVSGSVSIGTLEGRQMPDTRFTAIDSSHWTITRETTKLGEVTRDQYGGFSMSPAPGRVFRSDDLDSITTFMHTERDRDAVTLLPPSDAPSTLAPGIFLIQKVPQSR
jgi:hypothetical protein